MELIYTANKSRKIFHEQIVCSLSQKNLIALSCFGELCSVETLQTEPLGSGPAAKKAKTKHSSSLSSSSSYHVDICDIDRPWEVTEIFRSSDPIVCLQWHASGSSLLIATASGKCSVWQMKDYIINDWSQVQSVDLNGEEVICAAWLHPGSQVNFHADKSENSSYNDKMKKTPFCPSLSSYGGKPLKGWIAVTATGLVYVAIHSERALEPHLSKASLMLSRKRISVADIAFSNSGEIHVAISDGRPSSAVHTFYVSLVAAADEPCQIKSKPGAGFFAKCHADANAKASITHLRFMEFEDPSTMIVGSGDASSSQVEMWKLQQEQRDIHPLFQTSESVLRLFHWTHLSSVTHTSPATAIAVPRFPVKGADSTLFQYVAVAYNDGLIKLVDKTRFQTVTTTNLDMTDLNEAEGKARRSAYMCHLQQSYTGCVLLGLDQYGSLYAMKAVNTRDPVTLVAPSFLVGMLEFVACTHRDWWDIISVLKPAVVDAIIQQISDNLSQQKPLIREHMQPRMLAVQRSLVKSSCTGQQQRAADFHCRFMLHSVAQLFRSLLRPKAATSQEISAAEKLSATCAKNTEADIDKVMVCLSAENKDFVVEPATLQSLQQLMQWVGDLCLYLLTSLPSLAQGYSPFPGQTLLKDASFLSLLREILLLIRVWSLVNPSCAPVFTSPIPDCTLLLFKLLTRVWLSAKDCTDVEDALLDECYQLQSQVLAQPVHEGLLGDLDFGCSIFTQPQPLQLRFGQQPLYLSQGIDRITALLPEGQVLSKQRKDIVRLAHLGREPPSHIRKCSRCGCLSLRKGSSALPALRMWELRFVKSCPCGGLWMLTQQETQ